MIFNIHTSLTIVVIVLTFIFSSAGLQLPPWHSCHCQETSVNGGLTVTVNAMEVNCHDSTIGTLTVVVWTRLNSNSQTCGQNERLERCPINCPPDTCDAIGKVFPCPAPPPIEYCTTKGCVCDINFRRDKSGICIPIQLCPPLQCTGQNEVYNPCPDNNLVQGCSDLLLNNGISPNVQFIQQTELICSPSCICVEGYYRNDSYVCVPKADCFNCTGESEEYRESGPSCQINCSNLYSQQICTTQAVSGCFCQEGFVRNSANKCIKAESCYIDRCGPNEIRSCGPACDATCATYGLPCPITNIQCNDMCYCQDGYARDDCGRCIPVTKCPPQLGYGGDPNARNVSCPDPCPATCSSYAVSHSTEPAPCKRLCFRNGCQCSQGLVHLGSSPIDYCVDPRDCTKCPANEHWSCEEDCSCNDLQSCHSSRPSSNGPGCRCIDGYVRDENQQCIQAGMCPNCGPVEEFSSCGSVCTITCANKDQPIPPCVPLCVIGCFCKGDLVRDNNGRCIPPEQCPKL